MVPNHAMKTRVEFRSERFPPDEGEDELANDALWGQRLAEYLQARIEEQGVKTGQVCDGDWGWSIPLKNDLFPSWIGCGHSDGDDDEFFCFIEPKEPFVKKLFSKVDTVPFVSRIAETLNKILTSDPKFRDVRWVDQPEK